MTVDTDTDQQPLVPPAPATATPMERYLVPRIPFTNNLLATNGASDVIPCSSDDGESNTAGGSSSGGHRIPLDVASEDGLHSPVHSAMQTQLYVPRLDASASVAAALSANAVARATSRYSTRWGRLLGANEGEGVLAVWD